MKKCKIHTNRVGNLVKWAACIECGACKMAKENGNLSGNVLERVKQKVDIGKLRIDRYSNAKE